MSAGDVVLVRRLMPPSLDDWRVARVQEEALGNGYIVWLERLMPDGTTLRFEATLHDLSSEMAMMVPILDAVTRLSAPDVRLSVTRTRTVDAERRRALGIGTERRRRLTSGG